jgi:hypothetical protein
MIHKRMLMCILVVLIPLNALGQGAEPADEPVTRKDFKDLMTRVELLAASVNNMHSSSKAQLDELRKDLVALSDLQAEDRAQLEQLAKKDGKGRSYLRLDASHEPTRQELNRAIAASAPTHGIVTIDNRMGTDQTVAVNGTSVDIIAGTKRDFSVPIGDFTVQLKGQRAQIKYVGAPHYATIIPIRPEPVSTYTTWRLYSWPTYSYVLPW